MLSFFSFLLFSFSSLFVCVLFLCGWVFVLFFFSFLLLFALFCFLLGGWVVGFGGLFLYSQTSN